MFLFQKCVTPDSTVMPELVIEVNSPSDSYTKIAGMVQDWLKAGVKPVWVVEPSDNTVAVYDEGWKYTILMNMMNWTERIYCLV